MLDAAVVAERDADGLEKPKAYVVLAPGASADGIAEALKAHVQDKIGKWKYPRWVEVVSELPRTATGKIQRFKLREKHGAGHQAEERGEKLDRGPRQAGGLA